MFFNDAWRVSLQASSFFIFHLFFAIIYFIGRFLRKHGNKGLESPKVEGPRKSTGGSEKQIEAAFDPILYEDWWESQRIVVELEKRFGEEMGYPYTSAVQSGAAGLRLALLACGIKAGDEVITVANSDMATTASISQCGATPVLCDVQRSDHVLDPDLIEPLINERTRAILPVDLYGHPADVRRIRRNC